ncbi:unnamed protein product, partial [Urochloa humidicola]
IGEHHKLTRLHRRREEEGPRTPKAEKTVEAEAEAMGVMEKLKIFVVKEPVVAASCLIAGFGLFLPAVVRPILDSWETAEKVPPPPLNDVVAGVTGKKN